MKKITDYEILIAEDSDRIIADMANLLEDGWIPQGGICYNPNYAGEFFQAIIKVEEENERNS